MKKLILPLIIVFIAFTACNSDNESDNEETTDTVIEQIEEVQTEEESTNNGTVEEETVEQEVKQSLKQKDENVVFSFKTAKGKTMNIVMQKDEKYMAYRFGTENKVELQFPEKLENTFEQFTYRYYARGGGAANSGMDMNYLSFSGDTHKFTVFEEHTYGDPDEPKEEMSVGISITDLKTDKSITIKGVNSTVKGSLVDFRFNNLVKVEEEI